MSITATVYNGCVTLPPELKLPDGTEVEIVVRPPNCDRADSVSDSLRLPTFKGDGLQPGVDLDDSRFLRRLLEEQGKLSQMP